MSEAELPERLYKNAPRRASGFVGADLRVRPLITFSGKAVQAL